MILLTELISMVSMTNEELWQSALGELELTLSKSNFNTWFHNTFISSLENNRVIIGVPNNFTKSWVESKYNPEIKKTLQKLTNQQSIEIIYKIEAKHTLSSNIILAKNPVESSMSANNMGPAENQEEKEEDRLNKFGLNPKYTFDTFIVGKGNELAHAACQAVAQRPGKAYNPLFIYGTSGLGKTHLLHAVGSEVLKNNREAKVLYTTCEKFTNEFISSIAKKNPNSFRNKYREVTLLLIDDIQFIAGKEATQEEFFHTFNTLYQSDRQVILSSDRPPKDIPNLEQRLRTRFEGGMLADVNSPDLETRIAILETKCREKNYTIDKRILSIVATAIQDNVRNLEGVLTKIIAYHQFSRIAPSAEVVKGFLSSYTQVKTKRQLNSNHLISAVCDFYNITKDDLVGKTREQKIAMPRQILMYLMREELKCSFPSIGKELGGRDHTTVMHACKKIKYGYEESLKLKQELETLKQNIYSNSLSE